MFCKNCGNEIQEKQHFCGVCGFQTNLDDEHIVQSKDKYLPSFIMGLIGSILAFFGGCCTACMSPRGDFAFILIAGGAILGIVGACKCITKLRIGSILELISSIMMMVCLFAITGGDFLSILGFLLLLGASIVGLILSQKK